MSAKSEHNLDQPIVITREFAAPRALVFEAFSTAEHLSKWIGPDGFTASCTVDFRVGGKLSLRMVGHGMDHTAYGTYDEIVPNEKIVMRHRFEDAGDCELRQVLTFVERAGKTTVTITQDVPPWGTLSPAHQEIMRPRVRGSREGWTQSLQHLAEHLHLT